ncbi:hypothetical protein FB451DRAFT_1161968 [Mycena latifolia]|nr:hypothetical protein FB451DRAFT_1161968 [Mycena latifolia]
MPVRTAAYISSLPHPGPPPTCPLPPLPTQVTRAQTTPAPVKQMPPPLPKLPEGYAFIPPSVPLTYPASYHLIPAGPMNAAPKRRVRLPKRKEPEADLADESFCCRGGRSQWALGDHSDFLLLGLWGILGTGGSSQWLSHSTRIRALGDFMISFGLWGQTG